MPPYHRLNLHKFSWQFGPAPRRPFNAPDVFDLSAVDEWLPAAVPGNVRLDLLANHRIPNPRLGAQYRQSEWVNQVDWWYRAAFPCNLQPGQRAFLRFHGLDYLAAVFVNEVELTRHSGMFSRLTVEITDLLAADGCNLAVRLWGSEALPRRQLSRGQKLWQAIAGRLYGSWVGVYPHRTATLKMQMSFGWDFAPPVRTIGIWDEVECIITGSTFIEDAQVAVLPEGQGTVRLTLNTVAAPADIPIALAIEDVQGKPISRFSFHGSSSKSRRVQTTIQRSFELPAPKLWQPWDRGEPHLYTARLEVPGSDAVTVRFGVRSVELRHWQFFINGQREFVRGLNWVPADILPGSVTPADYAALLHLAKDSGANMLRVWGGGLREKRAFYNLCDELGLLVWQEFPFACMFLGSAPRAQQFLSLARQEVGDIVRQLDQHPSVVVWCGGNEFSPRRNRPLIHTMEEAIRAHSLSPRPFLPASPAPGDAHNWDVWHGKQPLSHYQKERAPFLSEFGLQALPHQQTLAAVLSNPLQEWKVMHGEREKLERYLNLFLTDKYTRAPNISALVKASQQAQAVGLQLAIEHMRRRKKRSGGVMVWQFNEPCPAISWALVDYFRRPKLAYRQLKTWFNPILVSVNFEPGVNWRAGDVLQGTVWGVNDTLQSVRGVCRVQLDGVVVFEGEGALPPDSAMRLGEFSRRLEEKPGRISAELRVGSKIIAQNTYNLDWHDLARGNWWLRLRRRVADWVLR